MAKQGSATSITLEGPGCASISWGAGVMSIFFALASMTLSFWFALHLRWVAVLPPSGLYMWIQVSAQKISVVPHKVVIVTVCVSVLYVIGIRGLFMYMTCD